MSLWPFTSRRHEAGHEGRILLDISGTSVAGACALLTPGRPPALCYGKRVPVTPREGEAPEAALARSVALVVAALEQEGLPALSRTAPGARVSGALVSMDAPWQQTAVRVEEKRPRQGEDPNKEFTFTEATMSELLRRSEAALETEPGDRVAQEVASVRLNGYQTTDPLGKRARRAALVILVSRLRKGALEAVDATLRERLGIRKPEYVSGVALRYRALSTAFPHERDLLILDAVGDATALSLIRSRVLLAVREFAGRERAEDWALAVKALLTEFAASYPLPRTLLLVADGALAHTRLEALGASGLGSLWFTEAPPKIVPVSRVPVSEVVLLPEVLPDIRLALMARFALLQS